MDSTQDKTNFDHLVDRLNELEHRLTSLEIKLKAEPGESPTIVEETIEPPKYETAEEREERYESTIGQSWMALVGTIVIVIGLCFFLSLSYETLPPLIPSIIGYFLVAGIMSLSIILRNSYSNISRYLVGGALILFYFSTLRLHFFGKEVAIESPELETILLTFVVLINTIISLRKNSVFLTSLSLTLGYITALVYPEILFLYLSLIVISSLSVYLKIKLGWEKVTNYFMPLTYMTLLLWFFIYAANVKILDGQLSVFSNSIVVLLYCIIYFIGNLKRKEPIEESLGFGAFALISSGFVLMIIFTFINVLKAESYAYNYFLGSFVFLIFAIILWVKEKSKYSTFVYALMGYFALSLAIISLKIPNYLILLSWQSLLVIATAVWFKSKLIVVANFFIYTLVLLGYYITTESVTVFGLSFGVVALFSARILNWNKNRLELKTEQMRNVYLISAFFAIPYTLYLTIPENFVSISWIVTAIIYYALSLVLNNRKYRWMSIYTFLLTLFYVAILGFTNADTTYKIISFLALGLVLIIISILYSKKKILNK
jgi:uncharacterized membrane protein